jgi:hypothetical protein
MEIGITNRANHRQGQKQRCNSQSTANDLGKGRSRMNNLSLHIGRQRDPKFSGQCVTSFDLPQNADHVALERDGIEWPVFRIFGQHGA